MGDGAPFDEVESLNGGSLQADRLIPRHGERQSPV